MKIIKRLIITLVLISTLGFVFGYLVLILILSKESEALRVLINQARSLSTNSTHQSQCLKLQETDGEFQLTAYQVRFHSETEYSLEAVCQSQDNQNRLIIIASGQLGFGVKKVPGYSGMLFSTKSLPENQEESSTIVLKLYFFMKAITYQDRTLDSYATDLITKPDSGNSYPQTSCKGWGFTCCHASNQVGADYQQAEGVSDCSNDCFQTCQTRPVILYFNTDPRLTAETRQLSITNNQLVLFSYSVQDPDSANLNITIDFGDGSKVSSTNTIDSVSHVYTCPKSSCAYTASINVTDEATLSHVDSRLSSVIVTVTP